MPMSCPMSYVLCPMSEGYAIRPVMFILPGFYWVLLLAAYDITYEIIINYGFPLCRNSIQSLSHWSLVTLVWLAAVSGPWRRRRRSQRPTAPLALWGLGSRMALSGSSVENRLSDLNRHFEYMLPRPRIGYGYGYLASKHLSFDS